ncbi:glycosyltransferase, family 4 [Aliarcobacter cibarius]|uniref:Glycosyltransferase, family 4 n=1 Tax=Aliarcobacter cibarius TaxID=255507 RepID=A0A7L5JSE5_9BACT|nr:glycosyltransferase family 4 protein [Aliarcobacter cibarius]QKJ28036.1 glycosyltransferase, family 4 [Aliarcobacter cibarius]
MKKVMFYCHVFYPQNSGYSNAFQNLINAILDYSSEIQITVVTPYELGENKELERDGLKIVRLKPKINIRKIRYFLNEYLFAREVSKKFKLENYNLLFVETFDQSLFINSLDSDIYDKTIIRIHSTNETEYTIFDKSISYKIRKFVISNFLSKKVINIASTNSFHIDFAKKYYFDENVIEIGNKNFFIIPNTIKNDNEIIDLNVGDKLKLFILGRMDRLGFNQKGFLDFIHALKLLDDKVVNRFEITVVGKGNEKSKILSLAKEFHNITFIDELPHLQTINFLKQSDIVVLPSRYEGLSMFALEGLATGNAVIFSKTGGLIDLVDGNGLFFEPQDIDSLVEALVKISNLPKDEIIKMKSKSIEIVKEKFIPFIVAKKFNSILNIIGS